MLDKEETDVFFEYIDAFTKGIEPNEELVLKDIEGSVFTHDNIKQTLSI